MEDKIKLGWFDWQHRELALINEIEELCSLCDDFAARCGIDEDSDELEDVRESITTATLCRGAHSRFPSIALIVEAPPNCSIRGDIYEKEEWIPTEDGGWIKEGLFWGDIDESRDDFNTRLEDAYGNFIAYVNSTDLDWIDAQ